MVRRLILCCVWIAGAARGSDWTGSMWERILETNDSHYATLRGLSCRGDTSYLVLGIDSEPNGIVDRYECWKWYPYNLEQVQLPVDVAESFRDMNYDSVDRARPAFLTDRTLYRQSGSDWTELDLSENDFTVRPQSFCFDSTGALHFTALTGSGLLRYSRRGGGLANRDELFDDAFTWGWADQNSARIAAPSPGTAVVIGADLNGGPSFSFQHLFVYTSPGELPFSFLVYSAGLRWKPRLFQTPGSEWIYGVHRGRSTDRRMLAIHGNGVQSEAPEIPVDALTGDFCFAWNPRAETIELATVIDSTSPRIVRISARRAAGWEAEHDAETPATAEGVYLWIDDAEHGHLFVCDSTRVWYYGPPADVGDAPRALPESISLTAYPNPFNSTLTLSLMLDGSGEARIEIVDVTGRIAMSRTLGIQRGKTTVSWSAVGSASGIYFARLSQGQAVVVRKIALVR